MSLAERLRDLAEMHGARPVAAALAPSALPLARAVLALDTGLLGQAATRDALQHVAAAPLNAPPSLPPVPASHREVWLRTLAAHVVLGTPWPDTPTPGMLSSSLTWNPDDRLAEAADLGQARGKPVTYAAASWAATQAVQDWVEDEGLTHVIQIITLEEAVLTLGAASRTRLKRLAELQGRVLILDGLHRLDPRGLRPVQSLIDEHAALGLDIHLTGGQSHPLTPAGTPLPVRGPQTPFTFETEATTQDDLVQLVMSRPEVSTLVMLPSRKTALQVHALLPWGRLQARVKTAAHLREEQNSSEWLHISTWSPSAMTFQPYERVIVTPMPLPILVDTCLAAEQVTLLRTPDFPVGSSLRTATSLTLDLLGAGAHPQDPALMTTYWEALLPHVQQDSLNIMDSRARLEYPQVASALASLFQSGVRVLVARPEAARDMALTRYTGRLPVASAHTVRMTHSSVVTAREHGWIEDNGDALIWTGPYSADRGVGVP